MQHHEYVRAQLSALVYMKIGWDGRYAFVETEDQHRRFWRSMYTIRWFLTGKQ